VLVRFDHVASGIINENHGIMRAAAMLRVSDCVRDSIRLAIPQPTEWQRIGNQIDAAFILARADFVNVVRFHIRRLQKNAIAVTILEIRPFRNGKEAYEAHRVEPVF